MTDEMKSLVEDAAKLLNLKTGHWVGPMLSYYNAGLLNQYFNPLDPERGDLMKVAMAIGGDLNFNEWKYKTIPDDEEFEFDPDHQSLALAVLRAASAVLKARGE